LAIAVFAVASSTVPRVQLLASLRRVRASLPRRFVAGRIRFLAFGHGFGGRSGATDEEHRRDAKHEQRSPLCSNAYPRSNHGNPPSDFWLVGTKFGQSAVANFVPFFTDTNQIPE
jgi:hypothetical protein